MIWVPTIFSFFRRNVFWHLEKRTTKRDVCILRKLIWHSVFTHYGRLKPDRFRPEKVLRNQDTKMYPKSVRNNLLKWVASKFEVNRSKSAICALFQFPEPSISLKKLGVQNRYLRLTRSKIDWCPLFRALTLLNKRQSAPSETVFESSLELYLVSEVHTPSLSSTHGTYQTSKYEVLTPSRNVFSEAGIFLTTLVLVQSFCDVMLSVTESLFTNQNRAQNSKPRKHISRRS